MKNSKRIFPNKSYAMAEQTPKPLNPSVDTLPREFLIQMYNDLLERNQKELKYQKNRIEKVINQVSEGIEEVVQKMYKHQDKHNQYLKPFILKLEDIYNKMHDGWELFNYKEWDQLSEQEYEKEDWADVDGRALSSWQEEDFDKMDEIIDLLQDMKSVLQEGFGMNSDQQWFQPRQNKLDTIIDLLEKLVEQNDIDYPEYKKVDVNWKVER